MKTRSHILEVRGDQGADVFRALANESRLAILQLLAGGERNINELGTALGLSQPTITKHVQQLELAGLLVSEYKPGVQGMQKRCRLRHDRLLVTFDAPPATEQRIEEVSMPIGLYTLAHTDGRCGLANRTKIIGFLDKPQSFYDPERATAQILWMEDGFVEYTFPNDLPTSMEVIRLELLMEICSEAPDFNLDWPSDLTVWINGVDIGTWTSPGDFGGKRGVLNPDWWIEHMTQHGLLKLWSVDGVGSFVDGNPVSDVRLDRLLVHPQAPITVRIGVKPDAEHRGGFNLFGSGFGNYAQDLLLRLTYASKNPSARRASALDGQEARSQ
ncbi:MAG: ArsR/SmtB family transcription factor [Fimbriimonas sp.]